MEQRPTGMGCLCDSRALMTGSALHGQSCCGTGPRREARPSPGWEPLLPGAPCLWGSERCSRGTMNIPEPSRPRVTALPRKPTLPRLACPRLEWSPDSVAMVSAAECVSWCFRATRTSLLNLGPVTLSLLWAARLVAHFPFEHLF